MLRAGPPLHHPMFGGPQMGDAAQEPAFGAQPSQTLTEAAPYLCQCREMSTSLPKPAQLQQLLKASPVFGSLPAPALAALASQLRVQAVSAGEVVCKEGEAADSLVVVLSGRLRVTRQGRDGQLMLFNELGPGECQGEAGLMLRQPRPADVSALRDSDQSCLLPGLGALPAPHPRAGGKPPGTDHRAGAAAQPGGR